METERRAQRCRQAAALLPPRLRREVLALSGEEQARAEEFRLRAGRPISILLPQGERSLGGEAVQVRELEQLV